MNGLTRAARLEGDGGILPGIDGCVMKVKYSLYLSDATVRANQALI